MDSTDFVRIGPVVATRQNAVHITIKNEISEELVFRGNFFRQGHLGGQSWPVTIHPGASADVRSFGTFETFLSYTRCEGYIRYSLGEQGTVLTIAFYNGASGGMINVGCEPSEQVFAVLRSFNHEPTTKRIRDGDHEYTVKFQCSSGATNNIAVSISK
eukprot:scpid56648/ scgid6931/ 